MDSTGDQNTRQNMEPDPKGKRKMFVEDLPEQRPVIKHKWRPPPEGWIKVNTDASFIDESGKASAGIIARDSHGQVTLTAWRTLRNCASVVEAEAEACLDGIRLASEWIGQPIQLESDCLLLINALNSAKTTRSSWEGSTQDIKANASLLPECVFLHVNRDGNQVAHQLARRALRTQEWIVRRHSFPDYVKALIEAEAVAQTIPSSCSSSIPSHLQDACNNFSS